MWEEVNIGDKALRIRKQRSLLADSIISKIGLKDGSIGKHDIIKADGEIYDGDLKQWRKITDLDLDNISNKDGEVIVDKIIELREGEKDFQEPQQKKQKEKSGE